MRERTNPDSDAWTSELDQIKGRYERREKTIAAWKQRYYNRIKRQREERFSDILTDQFGDRLPEIRALEIGAGSGTNLPFFANLGIPWGHIFANELREGMLPFLRNKFPADLNLLPGNALDVSGTYDVILASTVFTSILDIQFRGKLAEHCLSLLSDDGFFLWYDFTYWNPLNKDVRGIPLREVRAIFASARGFESWPIALSPMLWRCWQVRSTINCIACHNYDRI